MARETRMKFAVVLSCGLTNSKFVIFNLIRTEVGGIFFHRGRN